MRKFIHSSFELDLSPLAITDTAENSWFTQNYFAKYSYPFEIPLTDEMDVLLNLISNYNASNVETLFEGVYVHDNVMEKAVLEIEDVVDSLSATLRYGFDDFPNFKKPLSKLPLQVLQVDNIYDHAADIIPQTWPAVNYNFPQVHTDKYDTGDETWSSFGKIINNFKSGAFLVNDVDLADIIYNRNIMQPLPYVLHILKAGIEDAGYTLHGDILEDPELKKMLLFADVNYFKSLVTDALTIQMLSADFDSSIIVDSSIKIRMERELIIPAPGKYLLTGQVRLRRFVQNWPVRFDVFYRSSLIYTVSYAFSSSYDVFPTYDFNLNLVFSTLADLDPHFLRFKFDTGFQEEDILLMGEVELIALFDVGGTPMPTIVNENVVDLTRAVPEMLFGDLVKTILAMKNMDIDPRGKEIWINYIKKEVATRAIVDLSAFEVKRPKRTFNKGNSYVLRYQKVESEDYQFAEVFQNVNGISTADIVTDEKTTEININALPLPLLLRNEVQTAHAFAQDQTKPFFILYDGLSGGLNLAKDPAKLLIPYLHESYYQQWFQSMISSVNYLWSFTAHSVDLAGLTAKSRVHAYNNIHIAKVIQKKEVRRDEYEVEIETKVVI